MVKEISLKKENQVYESAARRAIYYSIVKCPDGIIRLYSNRWVGHYDTVFIESHNGIEFDQTLNLALKKSGACHNFTPFYNKGNKLMAIGGVDNWKHDGNFHAIKGYKDFKKVYEAKFKRDCSKEVFKIADHHRILSNKPILSNSDGLYLFESDNGNKWKQVGTNPIVTVNNAGYIDAIKNFGKGSEFDGVVNCVWDESQKLYFLYLRANVSPGFRYIQYSTSKDLINWDKFQLINIEEYQADKDNYYIPSIFRYKKMFVGLIPYFDQEGNCCIRLVASNDGINFKIKQKLFHEKTMLFKNEKPKNTCHPVYGILAKKGTISIYIHHNNLGLNDKEPVTVWRYTVPEKEFDEVVLC
jgi:hypothetical protein